MFDDFDTSQSQKQTRKRLRRSVAIAVLVYGSAGAALVSASNTARKIIKEELTQVTFATPEPKPEPKPEPPPPPPPVEAPKPKSARAGTPRKTIKPPDTMPDTKPTESDAPLSEPVESGPQDGVIGVVGGTGKDSHDAKAAPPPPPPPPPKLVQPKELAGNRQPPYPKRAQRDEVEGEVVVAFDVLENGTVANPKIVRGPEEFHEVVLQIAVTWRYQPAMLGGKPVKHRTTKTVVFRLEDA